MLVDLFKALMWLWPFVSEVFFDNKGFKEIIKNNKLSFFLFVLLSLSVVVNYLALSKISRIINDQKIEKIEDSKLDHDALQKQLEEIYNGDGD